MAVDRLERVNALLKRVIADAAFRVLQSSDVSAGSITVTGVACAKNLRNATVRVSVFGEPAYQKKALGVLIHHTHDFEKAVNREVRMKFTPQIRFELDHSLEKGDHVLEILDALALPPAAEAAAPAPEAAEAPEA